MMTIPYSWARVACPTCGAQSDTRCRTLTTGRSTDTHKARRYAQRYAENGCSCSRPWTGIAPAYGLSAYAIRHGGTAHPHDPGDLCRCLKVSPSPPTHMIGRSPQWTALVEHWDELADLLREEHPTGRAGRTYARMKEIFAEAHARDVKS